MSTNHVRKTIDDYPPLDGSTEEKDLVGPFDLQDESANADLKDKQPAGDAGPEDEIPEKEKKEEPKY